MLYKFKDEGKRFKLKKCSLKPRRMKLNLFFGHKTSNKDATLTSRNKKGKEREKERKKERKK
jgi:hypothetical protein